MVLTKYLGIKQEPANASVSHRPIPVPSKSQVNVFSLQNSSNAQF